MSVFNKEIDPCVLIGKEYHNNYGLTIYTYIKNIENGIVYLECSTNNDDMKEEFFNDIKKFDLKDINLNFKSSIYFENNFLSLSDVNILNRYNEVYLQFKTRKGTYNLENINIKCETFKTNGYYEYSEDFTPKKYKWWVNIRNSNFEANQMKFFAGIPRFYNDCTIKANVIILDNVYHSNALNKLLEWLELQTDPDNSEYLIDNLFPCKWDCRMFLVDNNLVNKYLLIIKNEYEKKVNPIYVDNKTKIYHIGKYTIYNFYYKETLHQSSSYIFRMSDDQGLNLVDL